MPGKPFHFRQLWPYLVVPPIIGFFLPPTIALVIDVTFASTEPLQALTKIVFSQFGLPGFFMMQLFCSAPFLGVGFMAKELHSLPRLRLYLVVTFAFVGALLPLVHFYTFSFYTGCGSFPFRECVNVVHPMGFGFIPIYSAIAAAVGVGVGFAFSYLPFVRSGSFQTKAPAFKNGIVVYPLIFAVATLAYVNHFRSLDSELKRDRPVDRIDTHRAYEAYQKGNYDEAVEIYAAGCKQGGKYSCRWLLRVAVKMPDQEKALHYFDLACRYGKRAGCEKARELRAKGM